MGYRPGFVMRRFFIALVSLALVWVGACGSDDGGGSGGTSGGGGSAAASGTTCMDGYPKTGTACAIAFEKCTSCGSYACCDVFECQQGVWAQTQSHSQCPSDGGVDAPDSGDDGSVVATDGGNDASVDATDSGNEDADLDATSAGDGS